MESGEDSPWGALWSVTDLSITDIFQPHSHCITEDCKDNVSKYLPQITDLEVTMTGSRKECSWISKLFRTDTELAIVEADLLISLKDQTLRQDESYLLERINGKYGFVRLKYPFRLWLNSLQDFANEDKYVVRRTDDEGSSWDYVSGRQCRDWVIRVQDANNPFTEPSLYREIMMQSGLIEDDSDITLNGPAATASFNNSGSSVFNMLAHLYKTYLPEHDPVLLDSLLQNYNLCLDVTQFIKRFVAKLVIGSGTAFPEMDLETGVIEYGTQKDAGLNCKIHGVIPSSYSALSQNSDCRDEIINIQDANRKLYEAVQKLQEFCTEIVEMYEVNINGTPLTSKLSRQHIQDPQSSIGSKKTFQDQLEYFIKAVSIIEDIKWHLEQDIYHETITVDAHMVMHDKVFNNLFMNNSYEADYVFCVKCHFWPDAADEWIMRQRASGFPSKELVDEIVSVGIHIVPKTYSGGDDELSWRYSFSIPEITLVENWTKVQRFAYLIVKSIYYEQLYVKLGEEKGKFSSYHIKTVMLWAVENQPSDWWNPNDITPCIKHLIDDIITALATTLLLERIQFTRR